MNTRPDDLKQKWGKERGARSIKKKTGFLEVTGTLWWEKNSKIFFLKNLISRMSYSIFNFRFFGTFTKKMLEKWFLTSCNSAVSHVHEQPTGFLGVHSGYLDPTRWNTEQKIEFLIFQFSKTHKSSMSSFSFGRSTFPKALGRGPLSVFGLFYSPTWGNFLRRFQKSHQFRLISAHFGSFRRIFAEKFCSQ